MARKRVLTAIFLLIAAIAGIWFYQKRSISSVPAPATPQPHQAPAAKSLPPLPPGPSRIAMQPPKPEELAQVPPNPMAAAIGSAKVTPEKEIALVLEIFQIYRREFGGFPAGETNAQCMNALRGANPGKLPIFPLNHPRLDPGGNLLDSWGQAYIFHQVSRDRLEIRSKGPDGEVFTADDLVVPR